MTANPLAPSWLVLPADANALAPGVWPHSARRTEEGVIQLGGVSVSDLVARYGTPLYVVDEADVRARARAIRTAFQSAFADCGAEVTVYYAGKAFLSTQVAKWMVDEGLSVDVASGGELAVALAAGVEGRLLGFHGNNKSSAEIDRAIAAGVGAIVIDSWIEIERVAAAASRHGVTQSVRLRVNTGVHAHTHDYLATAREDQKFGIALVDVAEHVRHIRSFDSLNFLGLHSHIGSQIFDAAGFNRAIERLMPVHAALVGGGHVPELNLGGGFGIAYTSADQVTPLEDIARSMATELATRAKILGIPVPKIAIEPGRAIIGPAGVTLYEAGTIKDVVVTTDDGESAVRRYVSVDGGMSDNVRPALYQADYSVRIGNRASDADAELVRVAGKHCESGDIVVNADYLPADVRPGDLLAVPGTGAYCWSLASNYNYLPRPAVIAVADAQARLLIRRESETELLARDVGIEGGVE